MKKRLKRLSQWKKPLGIIAFFLFFSILMTWPLVIKASDHLWTRGDTDLAVFILDHTSQKLLSLDLGNYFNAPFFYPLKNTIAFSEHLFIQTLLGLPVYAFTHNPILTFNFVIFLTFLMSGIFMYMLVYYLTGSMTGALIAGFIYAFLPYRINGPRLGILTWQFFPLVILYFEKFLKSNSVKDLIIFLFASAFQALSMWYYLIIFAVFFFFYFLSRTIQLRGSYFKKLNWKILLIIFLFVVGFSGILFWLAKPYFEIKKDYEVVNSLEGVYIDSLSAASFLNPGPNNFVYGSYFEDFIQSNSGKVAREMRKYKIIGKGVKTKRVKVLFPGFIAIFLTGVGFVSFLNKKKKRAIIIAVLFSAIGCLIFSLGPYFFWRDRMILLPYYWLRKVPGVAALRSSFRFIVILYLALPIFAGLGIKKIKKRDKFGKIIVLIFLFLLALEYFVIPSYEKIVLHEHLVYQKLASEENKFTVLELPIDLRKNYSYFIPATVHNKNLVNGYSGFTPDDYKNITSLISNEFPSDNTLNLVKEMGVKYVIIHNEEMGSKNDKLMRNIEKKDNLEIVEVYPEITLVEVK